MDRLWVGVGTENACLWLGKDYVYVKMTLLDTNTRGYYGWSVHHSFGMLMWHTDILWLDSITFCDEHTASLHVYSQSQLSWAGYLCDNHPDSQTIQLCEKIYHLQLLLKNRNLHQNVLYEPIPRSLQLTSVYTGWGHWLNHFKHPKESPTPKVNRYRY